VYNCYIPDNVSENSWLTRGETCTEASASYNCINITLSGVSALANENKTYNPTGSKHTGSDKEDLKPLYSTTTETSQDTYPPQLGSAPSYKKCLQTTPHTIALPFTTNKRKKNRENVDALGKVSLALHPTF
jgi:hypothetical protein